MAGSNNEVEKAEELKNRGNLAYKSGKYEEATALYTAALELDPKNVIYYSNRSAAYLSAGMPEQALKDAKKCSSIDFNYAKGFLRKGNALFQQRKFSLAMKGILLILSLYIIITTNYYYYYYYIILIQLQYFPMNFLPQLLFFLTEYNF